MTGDDLRNLVKKFLSATDTEQYFSEESIEKLVQNYENPGQVMPILIRELGKAIFEEKKDELKVERERLNEKYKTMLEERKFGFERLMKAFPNMKSKENNEILITMKNIHLKSIREKIERKKKG